jgi:hypothetical protein
LPKALLKPVESDSNEAVDVAIRDKLRARLIDVVEQEEERQ